MIILKVLAKMGERTLEFKARLKIFSAGYLS